MSPHRRRVLSLLARHVVVPAAASTADDADDKGAAARAIEGRLQELQAEKDSLQLEVGRLTGVGVPREFFRSASPDETAEFFRRNGYWLFEDAVQGEWLARLQHVLVPERGSSRNSNKQQQVHREHLLQETSPVFLALALVFCFPYYRAHDAA